MISIDRLPWEEAQKVLDQLTLEQKIGQMVIASVEVTEMDERTRRFLSDYYVGNVILFGKNCKNRAQIAKLDAQIQEVAEAATGLQSIISIDQEGGRVTRIRNGATVFPSAMTIGMTGDPENAYLTGCIMGNEMRALGICHDLAPVYDCNFDLDKPCTGNRSYAAMPEDVYQYASAMSEGLRHEGVLDCAKHFPGQGRQKGDTHFQTVIHNETLEEIMTMAVVPFRKAMADGLCTLMTSHSCYPSLEPKCIPNTISKTVIQDFCCGELGFKGLIVSDDILMKAISDVYGAPQGAVLSAEAGCDLVIIGNGGDNADPDGIDVQPPIIEHMVEAAKSGELSMKRIDESVLKIIAFKLALGDMRPAKDVCERDWSTHEAFAQSLTDKAVCVVRDTEKLLPLPKGSLFLCRASKAKLGVEEGDILFDSFAPYAAHQLCGTAHTFDDLPELDAWRDEIVNAPAVVFSVVNAKEAMELEESIRKVYELNHKLCVVCQDAGFVLNLLPYVNCAICAFDPTLHAAKSACKLMGAEGL